MKSRPARWLAGITVALCLLYAVLLIPDAEPVVTADSNREAFAWDRDDYWTLLEARFREARAIGCDSLEEPIGQDFRELDSLLHRLEKDTLAPDAPLFADIQTVMFELGTLIGACPDRLTDYIEAFKRLRAHVKSQSIQWDMNSPTARNCIYRLVYGGRTAIEEIMLQSLEDAIEHVIVEIEEPSATPSSVIMGVDIHSGDILISRGGAPTSALIARGNDHPGNFSHVALVHVDEKTSVVSIIESHIETGVAVASIENYLRDTKLRIMVLRPRSDLPAIQANPMLPHRAASYALERALIEHIPYDFEMDFDDPSKLFCSEVASQAYRHEGINLWMGVSRISTVGVKSWLAAFGVRHFITQEPSDLEYDPQLQVVAEWRDRETLLKDRLDNAVVDVMLEGAEQGDRLSYDWYMLPLARVMKAYSVGLNQIGKAGPIPEGMSATSALKNEWFSARHHRIREKLVALTTRFQQDNGYWPPYWELIKLARQASGQS